MKDFDQNVREALAVTCLLVALFAFFSYRSFAYKRDTVEVCSTVVDATCSWGGCKARFKNADIQHVRKLVLVGENVCYKKPKPTGSDYHYTGVQKLYVRL